MNKDPQILLANLGYSVAKIVTREGTMYEGKTGVPHQSLSLYILTPSTTDEGAHAPAESVNIYGLDNMKVLRDLLNQAIAIAHKGTSAEPVVEAMNQIQPTAP